MENGKNIKIGLALFDVAGIGGLIYFINQGWVDAVVFVAVILTMIVGCAFVICEINKPSIDIERPDTTPIYSMPLRKMGFRYDEEKKKWLMGGNGASFLVRLAICTQTDGKNIGYVECFNFANKRNDTLSYYVTCMEDVQFVMNLCGIIVNEY